ncbi:hypothetical protein PVK06_025056 [Gossypium arboreum]|uniref:Uncharacterized protein n=1 Tax=Gossypium arboreum TaxID=29729 RepID=A0ABR0PFS5_GOSAR|nr:hypothetical protein PVK06_025056 [Gossypium arboreum]
MALKEKIGEASLGKFKTFLPTPKTTSSRVILNPTLLCSAALVSMSNKLGFQCLSLVEVTAQMCSRLRLGYAVSVSWFVTLGPVLTNYGTSQFEFQHEGKRIMWRKDTTLVFQPA